MDWLDCFQNFYSNEEIFKKFLNYSLNNYQIIIGTDSNAIKNAYKFATVLVFYKPGFGADYYYTLSYEKKSKFRGKNNQKLRLFDEVYKSINLAEFIRQHMEIDPIIHIDASPKELNEFSSPFSDQLKNQVTSYGYLCELKPNSFAASCAANKHCR